MKSQTGGTGKNGCASRSLFAHFTSYFRRRGFFGAGAGACTAAKRSRQVPNISGCISKSARSV